MDPTRLAPPYQLDSFLLSSSALPWSATESVWEEGLRLAALGSDHLPVPLTLPRARTSREALAKSCLSQLVGHLHKVDLEGRSWMAGWGMPLLGGPGTSRTPRREWVTTGSRRSLPSSTSAAMPCRVRLE